MVIPVWLLMGALMFVVFCIVREKTMTVDNFENKTECPAIIPHKPHRQEYLLTGEPLIPVGISPLGEIPISEADLWAQAHPTGRGALKGKNFLDAGYMSSQIDTVGQNRKTMNQQLRSDPVVPQYEHSVFRPLLFAPTDIEQRILNEGPSAVKTC